jgi:hypothetical protein
MCDCSDLPGLVYAADHPVSLFGDMEKAGAGSWAELRRCEACGQLWRLDVWEKYQDQIAVKVPAPDGWTEFDAKPLILKALVAARGGLSSDKCAWLGCDDFSVRKVAYCPEHLFAAGARR